MIRLIGGTHFLAQQLGALPAAFWLPSRPLPATVPYFPAPRIQRLYVTAHTLLKPQCPPVPVYALTPMAVRGVTEAAGKLRRLGIIRHQRGQITVVDRPRLESPCGPGIYSAAQLLGWRAVTAAVHARGGSIVARLWHVGRISHVSLQPHGAAPVSSTGRRAMPSTADSTAWKFMAPMATCSSCFFGTPSTIEPTPMEGRRRIAFDYRWKSWQKLPRRLAQTVRGFDSPP